MKNIQFKVLTGQQLKMLSEHQPEMAMRCNANLDENGVVVSCDPISVDVIGFNKNYANSKNQEIK